MEAGRGGLSAVEARGLRLAYRETGSGDPVVLINGTGECSFSFGALMGALDAWRCVALDLRDTGVSSRVDAPYTPADLSSDAAAVIDALGLGACHIVGFSLGGAVAQELAIARTDLVRSTVLLSTWARSDEWFRSQMRSWQVLRRAAGSDVHAFDVSLAPWLFSPATMADRSLLARIHTLWDDAPEQEAEAFCRQCDADIAHDAADRLAGNQTPALVLVGDDDICTPPRYARELCDLLPRANLLTVADAGHCAIFERPEVVHTAIREFIASV